MGEITKIEKIEAVVFDDTAPETAPPQVMVFRGSAPLDSTIIQLKTLDLALLFWRSQNCF